MKVNLKVKRIQEKKLLSNTYVLCWSPPAVGPKAVRRHSGWCRSLGWAVPSVCSKLSGSYSEQQTTVTSLVPSSPGAQTVKRPLNHRRAWVIFTVQWLRIDYNWGQSLKNLLENSYAQILQLQSCRKNFHLFLCPLVAGKKVRDGTFLSSITVSRQVHSAAWRHVDEVVSWL